jgi:hypothetical protein
MARVGENSPSCWGWVQGRGEGRQWSWSSYTTTEKRTRGDVKEYVQVVVVVRGQARVIQNICERSTLNTRDRACLALFCWRVQTRRVELIFRHDTVHVIYIRAHYQAANYFYGKYRA